MSATAPSSPATRPSGAAAAPPPQQPPNASLPQPLIPLSFIDAPSQRFYACSLAIATQAWKYTHVVKALFSTSDDASSAFSLSTAILVDFTVLFVLSRLGIPRLDPRLAAAATPARPAQATSSISASPSQGPGLTYARYAVIFGSLVLVDSILLGQGTANPVVWLFSTLLGFLKAASSLVGLELDLGPLGADAFARQLSISEGRVRIRDLVQPKSHILGQHTVHILPYSTAKLSPSSACYCVGPGTPSVTIPVLFNNTEPDLLQYSVTDFVTGEAALFNISVTDLVALPASRAGRERPDEDLQVAAAAATKNRKHDVEGLGADEDELDEPLSFLKGSTYQERARLRAAKRSKGAKSAVRKGPAGAVGRTKAATQLLYHLPVHSAGRVRLERVLDKARNDARLSSAEALVVECPTSTFVAPKSAVAEASNWLEAAHKCPGESAELAVQVRGLTPLELQYRRSWEPSAQQGSGRNRHVEPLDEVQTISRISSPHHASPLLLPEAESILSPVERIALAQERTRAAARSAGNTHEDYAWAAASEVSIPLSVELERAGRYTYELESVKDACGNVVKAHGQAAPSLGPGSKVKRKLVKGMGKDVPSTVTSQQVVVHPRAKFAFSARSCQPGYPIKMLRTQSHLNVSLLANDGDRESGPWEVDLHFDPDNSAAGQDPLARAPATPWVRPLTMESGAGIAQVQVSAPGTYRIGKARGRYCTGEVESPWTCEVIDVPPPTAKISFSSIEDRCAGPVGVKALSILTGSPPFELEYEVRRHGERSHPIRRRIMQTRDELEFRPNTEGPVTYRFLKLHDANYRNMILDGPSFTQDVHPLATARFAASHGRSAGQPIVVHSCAGNRAQADVELGGTGPWDLTYIVRGAGRSETKEVKKLTSPRHTLDFELAPELVEAGGRATVSLVSIRDAKGCERQLATSDLNIEIRKARSTVGFLPVTYDTRRQVEILDGRQTRLPLRLEGDGPWTVTYSWRADESSPEQEETLQLSDSSAAIPARRPGVYTIKSIRDAYCPGSVLADQESYHVHVRSRPAVHFVEDAGQVVRNGSVVRAPVCQGRPDAVDVRMTGNFPLQIAYEHQAPSWSGGADVDGSQALGSAIGEIASQGKRRRNSFTSAQTVSNLELSTLTPGWHTYTIESVGDTAYPPAALQGFPRDAPRRLEQMVYPLPSASFVHGGKVPSFCIGDSLDGKTHDGKASGGFEPTVRLSGTPPFTVEFELHDITSRSSASASAAAAGGSRSHVKTIVRSDVTTHDYRLRIPRSDFTFETTGKWTLQVTRVRDAHGCEFAPLSAGRAVPASARIELEVAETAGISASSTRDDYCVGESVDFVLQGTPPWTVTYDFEGKTTRAVSRRPEFARVAERPGTLRIKSVAHQQNQCRTLLDEGKVEGMVKTIHDLPSVRVSEGRHYVEDLREGNQAEIIFDLVGEAPFSFTYQRTEPADTHSRPKVLETHTVQGILEDRFSIWTSVEGTWSVTWLMDRWCQVSLDAHSGSSTSLGKSRLAITPS
ncbi:uncharacterized protein PFL1_00794 [Pseudozyma flocculosa PF-1]|uniref:Related to Nuclear pore membrane protein n=1 Tax=Pseudozyma flocculosa TaxID=84751 RepID=A0A5C3F2U0_9BASI|nr:uncharacterized protein PFL1_00794 [Pseudozyma flocculosa PF-1]EPQ31459.1 hypothetical protein PFL1_00794 [Pseudozyma flocculosa PF-1]SPO38758.1 related to Nuclear pore membrane protein [Pseudozyma flocculosa]